MVPFVGVYQSHYFSVTLGIERLCVWGSHVICVWRSSDEPTAADVVNILDESELAAILKKYGEEPQARRIAHGIVQARSAYGRISTTRELADIVQNLG